MAEGNSENLKPKKTSDADRYEKLQLSAERQMTKIRETYEEHARLIRNYVYLVFIGASLLISLGAYLFFHNVSEMEDKARTRVEEQFEVMTNKVAATLSAESIQVDGMINDRFKKDNIDTLIETNVQARVGMVTEKVIENAIQEQFDPRIFQITNALDDLKDQLAAAEISGANVKDGLDMALTTVAALNDDRQAFFELIIQRDSGTNKYQHTIAVALYAIVKQMGMDYYNPSGSWKSIFNFDTNSWQNCENFFSAYAGQPMMQTLILQNIAAQTRFPRLDRYLLYQQILDGTPSLQLLTEASKAIDTDAHLNLNLFGLPTIRGWLTHEIDLMETTNYIQAIHTNNTNDASYLYLGVAYCNLTNFTAAVTNFAKAQTLNPTNDITLNAFAWLRAVCPDSSCRNGSEAVGMALKACELTKWKNWNYVGTLAAAYAECGDFDKAIKFQKQAMGIDGVLGSQLVDCNYRLQLYEHHQVSRRIVPAFVWVYP